MLAEHIAWVYLSGDVGKNMPGRYGTMWDYVASIGTWSVGRCEVKTAEEHVHKFAGSTLSAGRITLQPPQKITVCRGPVTPQSTPRAEKPPQQPPTAARAGRRLPAAAADRPAGRAEPTEPLEPSIDRRLN